MTEKKYKANNQLKNLLCSQYFQYIIKYFLKISQKFLNFLMENSEYQILVTSLEAVSAAISEFLYHNFLKRNLKVKLSKEFFETYNQILSQIHQKKDIKSAAFLRNIELFAHQIQKIVFASNLDNEKSNEQKMEIVKFFRLISYPIDLESFIDDTDLSNEEEEEENNDGSDG
ncbi:hypothetical protein TRFO_06434 [Tritrichomonas foetus]|uniref:Uncharacterized protein n=1 Tax=Tritrichomonas foetus TaxID=1144522 RepID=A0A1J4K332_9EUKA|nr:hypothetical protein TRFO_06434 [Tritrichomonas foetus]|eukprot:OHT04126.1 hypothetical protein TRFO_06434 [Tritrichomonas foetus]